MRASGGSVRVYDEAARFFAKTLGMAGWTEAMNWNDAPGRTQAEVVAALRAAAALAGQEPRE